VIRHEATTVSADKQDTKNLFDKVIGQIRFCRLKVSFKALEPISVSAYKGSAFRGCLGDAFRHEVCRFPGKKCDACRLQYECLFATLFESPLPPGHHLHGKYTYPPRPYLIIPMPGQETLIKPGNEFFFDLILVGSAVGLLPTLTRVFQRMGKLGIGTRYSKFTPVRIEHFLPATGYQPLPVFGSPAEITLAQLPMQPVVSRVTLFFEHPVRFLKARKPFRDPPPFEMLIENLSRRMSLLAHLYCETEWVDANHTFTLANQVNIDSHHLEWRDWTRYSGTKGRKLYFDGHVGEISYAGELAQWSALLNLGVWLHAGSTATFGLGKYSIKFHE
jgi:hypothetical protein